MLVELKDRLPPPTADPTAAAESQLHDALLQTLATLGMAVAVCLYLALFKRLPTRVVLPIVFFVNF